MAPKPLLFIRMLRDISPLKQRDQELVTLPARLIEAQEDERRTNHPEKTS